jgi:hypothetical protein
MSAFSAELAVPNGFGNQAAQWYGWRAMRLTALSALVLFAACSPPPDMMMNDAGENAPYPGPYGDITGSVIHNYTLQGFPTSTDTAALKTIALADFYNPTGMDKFPAGSPYGEGNPKPTALLIDRGAIWCGPCNDEAKTDLPPRHTMYFPGGQFLFSLDEGATPGSAPTQDNLKAWMTTYHSDYPGVLNPQYVFAPIVGQDAYPANIIVRTKDMTIVKWISGVPDAAFWQTFSDTIAGM